MAQLVMRIRFEYKKEETNTNHTTACCSVLRINSNSQKVSNDDDKNNLADRAYTMLT